MTHSQRFESKRAARALLHALLGASLACGEASSGGGALPEDPEAAYAALAPNCGTVVVALTPLQDHELPAQPFALPTEASPVSAHARRTGAAQGAWLPSASASAFSVRHPLLDSSLVDPEGDPELCRRAMALFSEADVETLAGGAQRRVGVYFAQTVEAFTAPEPAVALQSEGVRLGASAFTPSLRRVASEGTLAPGGVTVWEATEEAALPLRMRCEQGLELASRFHGYSADEYARAVDAGAESGTYCAPNGPAAFRCVGYVPQPTLDRCTLVVERAALTTEDGRAFRASLAGRLVRRGSAEDPYYELTLDKVRVD